MGEVPLKACTEPFGGSWGGVWVLVFQIPLENDAPPSTLHPESETRNPKPETRNPKPETRNPKPETRIPKPETRNPKPEIRNPKPKARHPKSETRKTRNPKRMAGDHQDERTGGVHVHCLPEPRRLCARVCVRERECGRMRVCACVREREREKGRGWERERERQKEGGALQ